MANNISGIGVDVVQIPRIGRIFEIYSDSFIRRILSEKELEIFKVLPSHKHITFIAKRFAAKEAISKALGTGFGNLKFNDIVIENNKDGMPIASIPQMPHIKQILLSISDDYPIATAFALIVNGV